MELRNNMRTKQTPGGNSSLQLGWGNEEPKNQNGKKQDLNSFQFHQNQQQIINDQQRKDSKEEEDEDKAKTCVRVRAPPGGKSNFTLG